METERDEKKFEDDFERAKEEFEEGEWEEALEIFMILIEENFRKEQCLFFVSRANYELAEYQGNFNMFLKYKPLYYWNYSLLQHRNQSNKILILNFLIHNYDF